MRPISICAAALLLAGCANSSTSDKKASDSGSAGSFGLFGSSGDSTSRPKTVVISDFILAAEVPVIDRGFSTRQESKGGNFPILERRNRTAARVNDEIIATIVATLQEAGLDAQPGSAEAVSLGSKAVVVNGRLRQGDKKLRVDRVGFGPGRGNVVADMTVSRAAAFGSGQSFSFAAGIPNNLKLPNGPAAAARNAAIAATLVAENASPEKLSPDVEAQARRLGLAVAEKIIAHGHEQGWLSKPESVESEASEADPETKTVKLPAAKPAKKPAA